MAVNGAVFFTSTTITIAIGFNDPYSVAVDGTGNVFVADYANNAVKEIVAVGGAVSLAPRSSRSVTDSATPMVLPSIVPATSSSPITATMR